MSRVAPEVATTLSKEDDVEKTPPHISECSPGCRREEASEVKALRRLCSHRTESIGLCMGVMCLLITALGIWFPLKVDNDVNVLEDNVGNLKLVLLEMRKSIELMQDTISNQGREIDILKKSLKDFKENGRKSMENNAADMKKTVQLMQSTIDSQGEEVSTLMSNLKDLRDTRLTKVEDHVVTGAELHANTGELILLRQGSDPIKVQTNLHKGVSNIMVDETELVFTRYSGMQAKLSLVLHADSSQGSTHTYSTNAIDDMLATKVDMSYLTAELGKKANISDIYPKNETFTQEEVNAMLKDKAHVSDIYPRVRPPRRGTSMSC